jgi:hypothetical protein
MDNKYAKWFRRSVWLGILADWALGIPTIFAPEWVLDTLGFRPTGDPIWTAFAALLVVLLSLFYIPGANQPYRYKFNAWLAVFARPPGVIYFLFLHPGTYPAFGILDGTLFLIQLPLLLLTMKHQPAEQDLYPRANQTKRGTREHATRWLKITLWLGILADWALGIPAIVAPNQVLELVGARATLDPVWTSFASMILVLLSLFYIPGANHPYRYRANAWMAVFARPPGVIFFLLLWPGVYPQFGILDGSLFLLELPFLLMTMQMLPFWRFKDRSVLRYTGTTFREVRDGTWNNPYPENPKQPSLGVSTFFQFLNDSARNLHDHRDIRPVYDKLIHGHGVAYTGVWEIDDSDSNTFTGWFAPGSRGLFLGRLSVAGLFVDQGRPRSLGMGGKVFPTMDPDEHVWPGNFVLVSHLSGSFDKHVLDIEMTNYPTIGLDPIANTINRLIFRMFDTRPGYRQLYPISTLGVGPGEPVVTPDLLRVVPADGTPRVDEKDFRDEIRLRNYPEGKLVMDIEVKALDAENWTRIGKITLTDDVVSEGSDKQLHFWIPRDIPNFEGGVAPTGGAGTTPAPSTTYTGTE